MNEFVPRRRTEMPPPPGPPEFCVICAPGSFPCSAWSTVTACARLMTAESTEATLVPSLRRSVGVARSGDDDLAQVERADLEAQLDGRRPPALTVTACDAGWKPMRRAARVRAPAGTAVIVKVPSEPVAAPSRVPVTTTCTASSARPDAASVTRPRTVPVVDWASSAGANASSVVATAQTALRRTGRGDISVASRCGEAVTIARDRGA